MKAKERFLFLLSEASGNFAGSIYGVTLYFMIQSLEKSQFINSLSGNISIAISVVLSFFAGHIVDKKSPWKIILLSDVLLIPLLVAMLFSFHLPASQRLAIIILINVISAIFAEFDSISRPKYLKLVFEKRDLDLTIQSMNLIQTLFSILGYLLVFLSVAFLPLQSYFILILFLYLISAISIFLLPKENGVVTDDEQQNLDFKAGFSSVYRFFRSSQQMTLLYLSYIIYILRNQLVMSLLIFRIGQLNPSFNKIHVIGLGIVCGVLLGLLANLIVRKMRIAIRKRLANFFLLVSALACFYVGSVQAIASFSLFGVAIGLIFGASLPVFNMLSSERILATPKAILGRSSSFMRLLSILLVFLVSIVLKFFDDLGLSSVYFDFASLAVVVVSLLFSKIRFEWLERNT